MNRNNNNPLSNEQLQHVAPSAFAGQPHESRSNRYAFVPTIEVIEAMRNHGYLPFTASQSLSRTPGKELFTKHMIRFRSAEQNNLTVVGDSRLEMVLINSHDGTSLYELMLGVFRLVCSNGLVVSESLAQSIKVRHTGNIVDQVLHGTDKLIQSAPQLQFTMNQWRQIELSNDEQRILAEESMSLRFEGEKAPVTVQDVLAVRRSADSGNNLWTVFNRIQEALVRGGLRYRVPVLNEAGEQRRDYFNRPVTRRASTREVKGIGQSTGLNKALWSLATRLAELKTK